VSLPLVSLLDGIAPGWWLALAVLLAGLEALTVTMHLIWPALAAALTALVLWLVPGLGGAAQLGLFALVTMALVLAGRGLFGRYLRPRGGEAGGLNRRAAALVGREAVVESFGAHDGRVKVDGVLWPARQDGARPPAPGARVRVTGAEGMVLRVEAITDG
jgi:inner membrane protein